MTDPKSQLEALQALRPTIIDPIQASAIDALITQLQIASQHTHELNVSDQSRAVDMNFPLTTIAGDQRIITTGTGDYIQGDADKRHGVFIEQLVLVFFNASGSRSSARQRNTLLTYLASLAERCDRLRFAGLVDWERNHGKAPTFTLSQLYVTLASNTWQIVAEAASPDDFEEALEAGNPDTMLPWKARRVTERDRIEGKGSGDERKMGETPSYRLERPVLLTESLSRQRRMVLLGGPGSGKSTFLRHLTVALARAESHPERTTQLPGWEAGPMVPLFASLGAYAAWASSQKRGLTIDGLWRFLLGQGGVMLDGLAKQFKLAFAQQRLIVLLDGLDEVAEPTLRAKVAVIVAQLADMQGYVVVTCRVRSFVGEVAMHFAMWGDPVELAPFSLGQIRHFIDGWYQRGVEQKVPPSAVTTQRAVELSTQIGALKSLRELAETPLLLTIIMILHYYEKKLPDDRADLYENMSLLLLTRWTAQRREAGAGPGLIEQLRVIDPRLGGLNDHDIRTVLQHLAYRAHLATKTPDGRGLLEKGIVREAFLKRFENFGLNDAEDGAAGRCAALVLRYLEGESGLLLYEGGDLYGLPHLTYEEYLAACHLVGQKGKSDFRTLAYDHWRADSVRWREVIFLALGRMVRGDDRDIAASWLDFLLLQQHGERIRDIHELHQAGLLAAECVREIGGKAKLSDTTSVDLPLLWQRLSECLVAIIQGATLPANERVRAGMLLGQLGDPRPGVTSFPLAMVSFVGGAFQIGNTQEEYQAIIVAEREQPLGNYAKEWYADTVNQQVQHVPPFELARYPVTNAQWKRFIDADGYNPSQPWWDASGRAWLEAQPDREPAYWQRDRFSSAYPNSPVVGICWYEAVAFATWLTQHVPDGAIYRLPTELEWEYACRGNTRRRYAWGDVLGDEQANYNNLHKATSAVGCFPTGATPEGLLDMTGNVWEWTRSEYRPYPYDPNDGREHESEPRQKRFTLRGGSWYNQPIYLRASDRNGVTPDYRHVSVGVRLARHNQ